MPERLSLCLYLSHTDSLLPNNLEFFSESIGEKEAGVEWSGVDGGTNLEFKSGKKKVILQMGH